MQTPGNIDKIAHRPGQRYGRADGLGQMPCRQFKMMDKDRVNLCNATNFRNNSIIRDTGAGTVADFRSQMCL